jgi:hypothetical protein
MHNTKTHGSTFLLGNSKYIYTCKRSKKRSEDKEESRGLFTFLWEQPTKAVLLCKIPEFVEFPCAL